MFTQNCVSKRRHSLGHSELSSSGHCGLPHCHFTFIMSFNQWFQIWVWKLLSCLLKGWYISVIKFTLKLSLHDLFNSLDQRFKVATWHNCFWHRYMRPIKDMLIVLCFVLFYCSYNISSLWIPVTYLPIFSRVASMTLRQLLDCPSEFCSRIGENNLGPLLLTWINFNPSSQHG